MPQLSTGESPLPVQRAFVVQLSAAADVSQGRFVGRVEHVRSGQATHFHSLAELLGFMARVLTGLDARATEAPEHAPPQPRGTVP